ncbi:hypothetical protein SDC9_07442 [bioreactor metagenome]|uniref:Uncharacterized protein n=1 Tax=bioreactor metagenome TaxID=1076179 RepID=A0A644T4K2_9ZZZZ|nr:hypothetical protein [Methanobrevibacter sp.]MEA4956898.1 hypothetical protein [Methanobrevibacter sp.]
MFSTDSKIRLIAKYEIGNQGRIESRTIKEKINQSGLVYGGVTTQKVQKIIKTAKKDGHRLYDYKDGKWQYRS